MSPLRRVEDVCAAPDALGILVPPGRRTVVIVRPRALNWDMVLANERVLSLADTHAAVADAPGSPFREMNQQEAAHAARGLFRALEEWYLGGPGGMETALCPTGEAYCVGAKVGPFVVLACPRIPGQPYRPMYFKSEAQANEAAAALGTVLFPSGDRDQEVYFNTRNFVR